MMHKQPRNPRIGTVPAWCWAIVLCLSLSAGCSRRSPQPAPEAAAGPSASVMPAPADAAPSAPVDAAAAPAEPGPETTPAPEPAGPFDPLAFHRQAIVIDTHNDVTLRLIDQGFDMGVRHDDGHTDLVRMSEGGLDAQFLAVWVHPRRYRGEQRWVRALAMFDVIERLAAQYPAKVRLVRTAAGVRATVAEGKTALLIGVEGAHAIGDATGDEEALERLRKLYERGARYLTLTWMNSNVLAGSSGDNGRDRGLTPLGFKAVRLMNDLGMMIDVSHVSDPTVFDVVKTSRSPVLASHSGARAINDHERNLTDDMLRAIAKTGGATCVVFYPGFLDGDWAARWRKARRVGATDTVPPLSLSRVADHIDHAVAVTSVDHVCLGSDFDGVGATPAGLEDVSKLPNLTALLAERGYSPEELDKILGGNVLRVLEANERNAKARPPARPEQPGPGERPEAPPSAPHAGPAASEKAPAARPAGSSPPQS